MIKKMYCVYDSGTESWKPPMCVTHVGEILRWWDEICNSDKTEIGKYPDSFSLHELGTWDDVKCSFDLFKAPVRLALAREHVKLAVGLGSGGRQSPQQSEA